MFNPAMPHLTQKIIPATATRESLLEAIKSVNPHIEKEDATIGVYLYCDANYAGQNCPLYQILCWIDFVYRGNDIEADFPQAVEARDILQSLTA